MVSDLLLLARSEQPTFLHPVLTDVGELTEDVFGKVVKLGEREWVLETAARVDAEIDPQRVTQAIVALADNVVRHTRTGDCIALGSQLAGGELRLWVADSGPGISEADRTRIFERFARGTSTGPRSDGAGLGLAIIRAIAVAHGGRVLLDSVVGRGATITVAVPAILPEVSPRACERTIDTALRGISDRVQRGRAMSRILIAEYEPRISAFVERG